MIKKREILELNDIIRHINSMDDDKEREIYLREAVEDVELFISSLRSINKSKLVTTRKKKPICEKSEKYTSDVVFKIFKEEKIEEIVAKYTKQDLIDMYKTIYLSRPLSSYNKERIAQSIYHHFYTINRAKALLG